MRRPAAGLSLTLLLTGCGGEVWPPPDAAWRARFSDKVAALVGGPAQSGLEARGEAVARADGVRVQSIILQDAAGAPYPGWLLLPPTLEAPAPAVLLSHGHPGPAARWVDGVEAPERALGAALARAGFVVLAPDVRSFGGHRVAGDLSHDDYAAALRDDDEVFVRLAARDLWGALDALRSHPDVDAARVGVLGQSLGGVLALLVGLADDQVAAVAISGIVMPFDRLFSRRNHFCQHFTALREVGDMPALVAALSPTAAQIHFGADDLEFVERNEGRVAALDAIDRWWADPVGAAPELAVTPGLGHAVDPDAHVAFFVRHLASP